MRNGFFNLIQCSYDIPFLFFFFWQGRPDFFFRDFLVMDSAGGNMEFTGFFFAILHFLFLFTSTSFSFCEY